MESRYRVLVGSLKKLTTERIAIMGCINAILLSKGDLKWLQAMH